MVCGACETPRGLAARMQNVEFAHALSVGSTFCTQEEHNVERDRRD